MLDRPTLHRAPYALFSVDDALSEARVTELEALFEDAELPWARHEDPLYRCFIADITARFDPKWLRAIADRMAELTELPLLDRAQVTAQRMEPGDHVGAHDDRPLLGYEAARLVVQLDDGWAPDDGGLFRAFGGERPILERYPRRNAAVGLALSTASLHEVTATRRARRSVVFNFWHAGNDSNVERLVRGLFDAMSFGALPDAVERVAAVAERELSEEDTHRAASVAYALTAWGYDADDAATGYRLALDDRGDAAPELHVAVALAGWLARLHVEGFDAGEWRALRERLVDTDPAQHPRLRDAWRVAFAGQ